MAIPKVQYLDNLRVTATLAVLLIHSAANVLLSFGKIPESSWWFANLYNGGFRYAVPIFVMLSGALLLPREEEIGSFFKKSFLRIIVPFLFYNSIFAIFNWQVRQSGRPQSLTWIFKQFFEGASYHFWYIYMIVGVYLFIPIIGAWVRQARESHLQFFLGMWLVTILFDNSHFPGLSLPVKLPYFTGYIGYLVLGYYLAKHTFSKLFAWSLFVIGTIWTMQGTYLQSLEDGKFYGLLYANFSPSVVMSTAGLFMLFKSYEMTIPGTIALRDWISSHSYGIYLIHIIVLFYLVKIKIYGAMWHPSIGIPLTAFTCLLISGAIVWLLRRIPGGKFIAG
jgi:surface polysaccharide O-acyltransferase-like enzyme